MTTLTGAYRDRLAAAVALLRLQVRAVWLQQFDDARPLAAAAFIGAVAAQQIAAAQASFAAETATWLAALTAAATGTPLEQIAAYTTPDVAGTSAAGVPLADMTGLAPRVWWARFTVSGDRDLAQAATQSWLDRLAASEPYRAANHTVTVNAGQDARLSGRTRRVTGSAPCPWCADLAGRGYRHADFRAHPHCACTAEPEIAA